MARRVPSRSHKRDREDVLYDLGPFIRWPTGNEKLLNALVEFFSRLDEDTYDAIIHLDGLIIIDGACPISYPDSKWIPCLPFILFFSFSAFIIEFIRRRVTYPRIGYAKMVVRIKPSFLIAVVVPFMLFPLILAIAVSFFSDVWNIDPWLKWSPALFGVLLAIVFYGLGVKSGDVRYYVLSALSVVSGFVLSFLPFSSADIGIVIYFLVIGGLLFLSGLVMLILFLRRYPKLTKEEVDGGQ